MSVNIRKSNYLFLMITFAVVIYIFFMKNVSPADEILATIFQFAFIFAIPILMYQIIWKVPLKSSLPLQAIDVKTILLTLAFSLCLIPLAALLSILSNLFFPATESLSTSASPLWYTFILVAILPPLFEEITFRGFLLGGYAKTSTFPVALLNALAFSLIHLNTSQFLYAFLFGFCFVYLFRATRSIYSVIFAHFVVNGTNVFLDKYVFSTISEENGLIALVLILLLSIIFTLLAKKIYRHIKAHHHYGETSVPKEKLQFFSFDMIPYYLSIAILCVTMFLK